MLGWLTGVGGGRPPWGVGRSSVGGRIGWFPLLVRPLSGRYFGAIGKLEARRWQTASTA